MTQNTRDAIVREAARQLATAGADGLTMSRVAEAVGIRPASIFHHFPGGKAEVEREINSVVTATVAQLLAEELAAGEERNPAEAVMKIAVAFWDLFEQRPEIASLMIRRTLAPDFVEGEAMRTQATQILESSSRYIREAQARGQIAEFDLQLLFVPTSLLCISYHGAPGLRSLIETMVPSTLEPREAFLDAIRRLVEGT